MVDEAVYPQDAGTGISETVDWNDAGAFAQLAYDLNTTDYVLQGFEFTDGSGGDGPDYTNNILNITGGVARVSQEAVNTNDHTGDDGPAAKTLELAAFVCQSPASGDLSLTEGAVNHVYVAVDQSTNDATLYQVNTDGTEPPEPSLKLGTVDTSANLYSYVNRLPSAQFSSLEIRAPPQDQ